MDIGMPFVALFGAFIYLALANESDSNELNSVLFSGNYEFIDLTYPFGNNTIYWPDAQPFVFTKKVGEAKSDDSWYATNEFAAAEHGGTHIDAPYHFYQSGNYVGEIPMEKLIVQLIIVDVSSQVKDDPNFVLYKRHLDNTLRNGNIDKPSVIIFKFGWSKFYNDRNKYLGISSSGLNFPGLSAEVADWIVNTYKNVVGIGMDVSSVDPGSSTDYSVHKILQKAGLYNMENVKLTRKIPDRGCVALVLPMKISMGTGAPLRLVAICQKHDST